MSMFTRTATPPDRDDPPDSAHLPEGYDDPDSPRYVHPDLRPHYTASVARDRYWLEDHRRLVAWARKRAILDRYDELTAREDHEIAAGRYPQNRRGDPGPRLYPPEATIAERMLAVGTDYSFNESAIGQDTVEDFLHACRCADAADALKHVERRADTDQQDARRNTCPVCTLRYPTRHPWGEGEVTKRDVAGRKVWCCPKCATEAAEQLRTIDAAEQIDGTTRSERVAAWIDQHLEETRP
jgi:hypothetical protein